MGVRSRKMRKKQKKKGREAIFLRRRDCLFFGNGDFGLSMVNKSKQST